MEKTKITLDCPVHFKVGIKGHKHLRIGQAPDKLTPGTIPRVSKLMSLAIRFEEKLAHGEVRDLAHIAQMGNVTRARVTQIMNLRLLAPDIQKALLNLPRTTKGRAPIHYRLVLSITQELEWPRQRELWQILLAQTELAETGTPDEEMP